MLDDIKDTSKYTTEAQLREAIVQLRIINRQLETNRGLANRSEELAREEKNKQVKAAAELRVIVKGFFWMIKKGVLQEFASTELQKIFMKMMTRPAPRSGA